MTAESTVPPVTFGVKVTRDDGAPYSAYVQTFNFNP